MLRQFATRWRPEKVKCSPRFPWGQAGGTFKPTLCRGPAPAVGPAVDERHAGARRRVTGPETWGLPPVETPCEEELPRGSAHGPSHVGRAGGRRGRASPQLTRASPQARPRDSRRPSSQRCRFCSFAWRGGGRAVPWRVRRGEDFKRFRGNTQERLTFVAAQVHVQMFPEPCFQSCP